MKFKLIGTLAISALLMAGCQGGGKKDKAAEDQQAGQEGQSAGQEQMMPGQMQQAQDIEVSDQEIQKFVDAAQKVQQLNMQMQQDVSKAVQDEGMETQRFNEIHRSQQAQQQGQGQGQTNATEQEMEQYQNILDKLQQMQSGAQEDMQKAIEDAGLSMQRYQQIATAAQRDTALMKRLQDAMRGAMMQQQGAQ